MDNKQGSHGKEIWEAPSIKKVPASRDIVYVLGMSLVLILLGPVLSLPSKKNVHSTDMNKEIETTIKSNTFPEGAAIKNEEVFMRREVTFSRDRFDDMMAWSLANGWNVRRIGPFKQEVDAEDNETGVNKSSTGEPAEMQVWVMEKSMKNFNKVLNNE